MLSRLWFALFGVFTSDLLIFLILGAFEERDNNALNNVTSALRGLTVALPHSNSPGSSRGNPPPPPRPILPRHASLPAQPAPKSLSEKPGGASGATSQEPMSMPGMRRPQDIDEMNECSICFEQAVDSVLYTCGHMCTCYDCALIVKKKGQLCPICRKEIKDVIKIYRSWFCNQNVLPKLEIFCFLDLGFYGSIFSQTCKYQVLLESWRPNINSFNQDLSRRHLLLRFSQKLSYGCKNNWRKVVHNDHLNNVPSDIFKV
jgi:hypothetical protein